MGRSDGLSLRDPQFLLYAAGALAANPDCVIHEKPERQPLPEGMPDHLSISTSSPHFHGGVSAMVGVRIDGTLVGNCYEFCVSEGWYRLFHHRQATDKMRSDWIEPFWRIQPSRQVLKRLRRS